MSIKIPRSTEPSGLSGTSPSRYANPRAEVSCAATLFRAAPASCNVSHEIFWRPRWRRCSEAGVLRRTSTASTSMR